MAELVAGDGPEQWLVRLDGMDQSFVDLADPTHLRFDYVRRTGDLLDGLPAGPLRVLHVGGAGLTLPRYVAATHPGSRQVVLEPDADLVELVRAELPLPRRSGISVRPEPGRAGLAGVRDAWAQAVVVDAFAAAEVPRDLVTLEAWQELDRVTAPGGLLVLNLTDRAPFAHARDVLAGLRATRDDVVVGVETATWRGKRRGNLLLVAGAADVPSADPAYRWLTGDAVADSLGGGTPLHDEP